MEVSSHQKDRIGRPKLRWSDAIHVKEHEGQQKEEAQDQGTWRINFLCADPK